MKKFFGLIALSTAIFCSCDKDEDTQDYGFVTNGRVTLRFVNAQGEDLVDPHDMSTYPIIRNSIISQDSVNKILSNVDSVSYGDNSFLYDGNWMELTMTDTAIYIFPSLLGEKKDYTNNYLYINGEVDTLRAYWHHYTEGCDGGYYCSKLTSLTYNGEVIYEGDDSDQKYSIVTVVKDNGKTTIKR